MEELTIKQKEALEYKNKETIFYNIDIKTDYELLRKVTKVRQDKLTYFINLYITDNNMLIITKYIQ